MCDSPAAAAFSTLRRRGGLAALGARRRQNSKKLPSLKKKAAAKPKAKHCVSYINYSICLLPDDDEKDQSKGKKKGFCVLGINHMLPNNNETIPFAKRADVYV